MSNQCQLNFPTRLLSPDSRRVSTPGCVLYVRGAGGPRVVDGWPFRTLANSRKGRGGRIRRNYSSLRRSSSRPELAFYQEFATRWPDSKKLSEIIVKLYVRCDAGELVEDVAKIMKRHM